MNSIKTTAESILRFLSRPSILFMAQLLSIGLLLILPAFRLNSYIMNIVVKVMIYITLALGLNILVGYVGLVSLGQAGFVAVGAYTTTVLTKAYGWNFFASLLLCVVVSAIVGILIGMPSLRLTGTYLSIITFGFGEIIRTMIIVWEPVTNGPLGIRGIPRPELFGIPFSMANGGLYYLSLILMLLVMIFSRLLYDSKTGRAFRAIKGDETAAVMMGINVTYYKVMAFVLAAVISALAGSLYANQLGYIDQNTFTFDMSTMILSVVILGGMGTIRGMVVGSVILVLLPELSRSLTDYRFVIYGLILILMMRFRPQGILGWKSRAPYPIRNDVLTRFESRLTESKGNQP